MGEMKGKRFNRSKKERQALLSSDGRRAADLLRPDTQAGLRRLIAAHFDDAGFTPAQLRDIRGRNGVGRPPRYCDVELVQVFV